MAKINVLVIDDSALVRKLLSEILNSDPGIEVIGTAIDAYQARAKIKRLKPDVLTLDVEMPGMNGVTFLKNLMRLHPLPVVMVSTLTQAGAQVTLDALELGAVDFVSKPKMDLSHTINDYAQEIIQKVKTAATVNVDKLGLVKTVTKTLDVTSRLSADVILPKATLSKASDLSQTIISIGASTGGTEAIKQVLQSLPADCPAIVITQHIPAAFSQAFALRLDRHCALSVCQAEHGQRILPGHAYLAPGDKHLIVRCSGDHFYCELNDGPLVNRHKPSVDVLFRSMAQNVGANAIGILLTGMGDDGAQGMLEMKQAGAFNFVQDEKSSVVWGMPGQAVKIGAATLQVPLVQVATILLDKVT
ncbi:MAG: chemotaxis response regulator protein-glutamate methylesterase [Gammaproteobacteria bacterium]|nr:chemotaxis response regulator protein-glutamate methylesterase [Gammaproteobacteria bacterium]